MSYMFTLFKFTLQTLDLTYVSFKFILQSIQTAFLTLELHFFRSVYCHKALNLKPNLPTTFYMGYPLPTYHM
jgi:hypothetical protein